jgi:hypothetical protein
VVLIAGEFGDRIASAEQVAFRGDILNYQALVGWHHEELRFATEHIRPDRKRIGEINRSRQSDIVYIFQRDRLNNRIFYDDWDGALAIPGICAARDSDRCDVSTCGQ